MSGRGDGSRRVGRVIAAALVGLVAAPAIARAQGSYREPDLQVEIFRSSQLSLDASARSRAATLLGGYVRNHLGLNAAPPRVFVTAARMLGLALRLDPQNKVAYVANVRLRTGEIPAPAEAVTETARECLLHLVGIAHGLRQSGQAEDRRLAAYLVGVLAEAAPEDEAVLFEQRKLDELGVAADWTWAPEQGGGVTLPATAAPAPADGKGATFARAQATVKGLMVRGLETGELVGVAMDVTATVAPGAEAVAAGGAAPAVGPDSSGVPPFLLPPAPEQAPPLPREPPGVGRPPAPPAGPAVLRGDAGAEMRASLGDAVRAAQSRCPGWQTGRVEVSFGEKYNPKDGGSAGAAFALVLLSLLEGFEIDPAFAITGDLSLDGRVGKVGGIPDKIRGAIAAKCAVVAIPRENRTHLDDLVILHTPSSLAQIQVVTVDTVDGAIAIARADRPAAVAEALRRFAALQPMLLKRGADYVRSLEGKTALRGIVELFPGHASAEGLLQIGEGKNHNKLSVNASLVEAFAACHKVIPLIWAVGVPQAASLRQYLPRKAVADTRLRLVKLKLICANEVRDLVPALQRFLDELDEIADGKKGNGPGTLRFDARRGARGSSGPSWENFEAYRRTVRERLEGIGTNQQLMEKIVNGN